MKMKISKFWLFLLPLLLTSGFAHEKKEAAKKKAPQETVLEVSGLKVNGLTCEGCAKKVKKAVFRLPGVKSCEVNVEEGTATVEYDPSKVSAKSIAARITDAGFKAKVKTIHKAVFFSISPFSEEKIKKTLNIKGIIDLSFDKKKKTVKVVYHSSKVSKSKIASVLKEKGFKIKEL